MEVPEGNKLGFVILQQGNVEVMYQSFASADKDVPAVGKEVRKGPSFLYVGFENFDTIMEKLKGADVYLPVRTTFYGMKEIGVRDPAGHFIAFAARVAPPAD